MKQRAATGLFTQCSIFLIFSPVLPRPPSDPDLQAHSGWRLSRAQNEATLSITVTTGFSIRGMNLRQVGMQTEPGGFANLIISSGFPKLAWRKKPGKTPVRLSLIHTLHFYSHLTQINVLDKRREVLLDTQLCVHNLTISSSTASQKVEELWSFPLAHWQVLESSLLRHTA